MTRYARANDESMKLQKLGKAIAWMVSVAAVAGLGLGSAAHATVAVYPDYPNQIATDTVFSVKVWQGADSTTPRGVTVYNSLRPAVVTEDKKIKDLDALEVAGDIWRRFCEFSASNVTPRADDLVTVQIRIDPKKAEFHQGFSYTLVQSGVGGLTHSEAVQDGAHTITVKLSALRKFIIRVKGDDNKTLAVFPDAPEVNPPKPGDAGVKYIGSPVTSDYYTPTGTDKNILNVIKLASNETLYVKPGAVLNARVMLNDNVSTVTIKGRGIIRDGVWIKELPKDPVKAKATSKVMLRIPGSARKIRIEDVKLIDTNSFNIHVDNGGSDVVVKNVKMLSNRVNSDGFAVTHQSTSVSISDSFIYNADNVFLIGQSVDAGTLGGANNVTFENNLVGSPASTIFLQGKVGANVAFRNNTVFRNSATPGDDRIALISAHCCGKVNATWDNVVVENLNALGTTKVNRLFYTTGTGNARKSLTLRHVYLPTPAPQAGSANGPSTPTDDAPIVIDDPVFDQVKQEMYGTPNAGNVQMTLDDVWYGNAAISEKARAGIVDRGTSSPSSFSFAQTNLLLNNAGFETNGTAGWTGSWGNGAALASVSTPGVPHGGSQFARVSWGPSGTAGIAQDVKQKLIDAPGYYRAEVWVKVETGTLPITLRLAIDGTYPLADKTITATTSWQKVAIEGFVPKAPATWATLAVAATGSNVKYFVDDASLVRRPNLP